MEASSVLKPSDLLIRESSDLCILEAADGGDGVFNPDGTVNMVLIRPCNGRGLYNNIYETDVLARDAGKFKGWSSFDNHESPQARKVRHPFPRPVSELAGAIRESFWDPDFTAKDDQKHGFGKGAVVGKVALTDAMEALVRKIPEAIKGSLNAQATNKRLGERDGRKGWIVEGFVDDPENSSFDLVTKAGAGGRVRSVLESLYDAGNATSGIATALEGVTDQQLGEFLREHRPDVLEGGPAAMTNVDILESLRESDEFKQMIADGVSAGVTTAMEERETAIRESVREEIGQAHRLRGLRDHAKDIIETSKLPKVAQDKLLTAYGLDVADDDSVTAGLSLAVIEAEVDGDGKVTKSDRAVLDSRLEDDIKSYRDVIREASPTVPRAPGGGGAGATSATFGGKGSQWADRLRQRGIDPTQFGATKPEPATTTTE